jgi:hypothetical protein
MKWKEWMAISLAERVAIVYLMEAHAFYGLGRERWLSIVLAIALNRLFDVTGHFVAVW